MSNMSYCRFENTGRDLDDCIDAIENGEIDELNEYEIASILHLKTQAKCIIELFDEIDEGVKKSNEYNQE